jgi:hypothetical protein
VTAPPGHLLSPAARSALALLAGREPDPLDLYDPTVAMAEVHRSEAVWRFVRKPNQVGGTYMMGAEVWWAALASHPWRWPIHPSAPIWILISDLEGEYRTVCEKLWETAPRSRLATGCRYVESKGFTYRGSNLLVLDNGRRIEFKSGTQNVGALESGTVGAAFVNEPPSPDHLSALMQRCAVHSAPVLMNFTPVGRPLKWLRSLIEGDPDTQAPPEMPGWECFLPALDVASCTTITGTVIRSTESIAAQVASMTPWQRAQRQFGAWEGESADRRFVAFTEAHVIEPGEASFDFLRLGLDHGEGDGKQVAVLIGVSKRAKGPPDLTVVAESVMTAAALPAQVAAGIAGMLSGLGLSPHHIERAFGDINSAGFLGAGTRYNAHIEAALAVHYASTESPIRINPPDKRAGSVDAGEGALHHAMLDRRFRVWRTCRVVTEAARHYRGPKDGERKDPIDAVRYAVADLILDARPERRPLMRG